eukprot:1194814-Prorocentrum_minimum.AAC.4
MSTWTQFQVLDGSRNYNYWSSTKGLQTCHLHREPARQKLPQTAQIRRDRAAIAALTIWQHDVPSEDTTSSDAIHYADIIVMESFMRRRLRVSSISE